MTQHLGRSATVLAPDADAPLRLLLRLCGFETLKDQGYTAYYVRVSVESELPPLHTPKDSSSERTWHVRKRYRQFLELQRAIIRGCGYAPPLPAKRVFGNLGTEFVKKRAQGLSVFLWSIASNRLFSNTDSVRHFLWSDVAMPKTRVLMSLTPMIRTIAGSATSVNSVDSHSSGSGSHSHSHGWDGDMDVDMDIELDIDDAFDLDEHGPNRREQLRRRREGEQRQRGQTVTLPELQQAQRPRNGRLMLTSYEDLRQSFEAEGIPFEDVDDCEREKDAAALQNASTFAVNQLCNFRAFSKLCSKLDYQKSMDAASKAVGASLKRRKAPTVFPSTEADGGARQPAKVELRVRIPPLRIVFLLIGSRGDVQPYVALGLRLKKAGHCIRIAAHECFRGFVHGYGLGFAPLAGDPKELMRMVTENNMFSFSFVKEGLAKHRQWVTEVLYDCWDACTLPEHDLRHEGEPRATPVRVSRDVGEGPGFAFAARFSSFRADAIIANPPSFAGWHISEALGVPLLMSFPMPWTRTTEFPSPFAASMSRKNGRLNWLSFGAVDRLIWLGLGDLINAWRVDALRLSPIWTMSAKGHRVLHDNQVPFLYCWSEQLMPKPHDWGPHIQVCGYWFLNKAGASSQYQPDPGLTRFMESGSAPIYIGFGSIVVSDAAKLGNVLVKTIKSLSEGGATHRFLIQQGWANVQLDLDELPSEVRERVFIAGPIPHDWLFPKCQCLVHHGGAGTTAEGLRAGVPTVIVPFFGDQFFWGRTVRDAEVGTTTRLHARRLCKAIRFCLEERVGLRAQFLSKAIRKDDGVGQAVQCIETYFDEVQKMMEVKVDAATAPSDLTSELSEKEWIERHVHLDDDWRIWPFIDQRDRSKSLKNASPSKLQSLGRGVRALGSSLREAIDSRKPSTEKGVELMEVFDSMAGSTASLPVVSPGVPVETIPIGHTSYTWQAISSGAVPPGHTPFSWHYT